MSNDLTWPESWNSKEIRIGQAGNSKSVLEINESLDSRLQGPRDSGCPQEQEIALNEQRVMTASIEEKPRAQIVNFQVSKITC